MKRPTCFLAACAVAAFSSNAALGVVTLLDDHFNDGTLSSNPDTGGGFVADGNGVNVAGSVSESGSQARILDGTGANTFGMRSSNAFDLSNYSLTYTTTWEVANWTSGSSGSNRRTFFTLQTNDDWIFNGAAEESRIILIIDESLNNAVFRYQNRSASSNTNFDSSLFDLGTFAQDTDGFTATLVLDSTGFNFTTAGLAATNQVNLAGTWASLGTNFSTALGTDGPMHVTSFIQDPSTTGSSLDIDRITLTSVPEPSGLILLGLTLGLGAFIRRR